MQHHKIQLLWIDDQIKELTAYILELEKNGFIVSVAQTFEEGIQKCKDQNYDVILSDIMMPPPDGIELLKSVHAIQERAIFILCSSYLYNDIYRERIRNLPFDVILMEKDLAMLGDSSFKDRFLIPLKSIILENTAKPGAEIIENKTLIGNHAKVKDIRDILNKDDLKMSNTILLITALHKELEAIINYLGSPFDIRKEILEDRIYYTFQKNDGLKIVCVAAVGIGQLNAAIVAKDAINAWNPMKIILTGICGAIKRSISLGDIIVSNHIVDYEIAKIESRKRIVRWNVYRSDSGLLNRMMNYKNTNWIKHIKVSRPDHDVSKIPKIHFGTVLSGNKIIANKREADSIKSIWDKAYAIEMEAAAIAAVINQMSEPPSFIMAKSACDFADSRKNDDWQSYAANASAAYVISFIYDNYSNLIKQNVKSSKTSRIKYDYRKLRYLISEVYSNSELNSLAFDLGIDYEDISGSNRQEKITELIKYCARRRRLGKMIEIINNDRDNILQNYSFKTEM